MEINWDDVELQAYADALEHLWEKTRGKQT